MAITPARNRSLSDPVLARSIEVLKAGQSPSGALVASPGFGVYRYAWLRDGAFCAYALDLAGEHAAARAWHEWVLRSVEAHRGMIERATEQVAAGDTPGPEEMPPARYTLDGTRETDSGDIEPWPNFQVDGYGMWLWSLERHLAGRGLPSQHTATVELVARYLDQCGLLECWDCWEEYSGGHHAATVASAFAGLTAAAGLLDNRDRWSSAADRIHAVLLSDYLVDGRFRKGRADDRVDGSLLWLSAPFEVLRRDDTRIVATVEAVRQDLCGPGGGVYRFLGDTYFGGGQWLLLTSCLAWHDVLAGHAEFAARGQDWVRAQALENFDLPEQVSGRPQDPSMVAPWIERWGNVATPLLWSHAMYLIAERARP
jgi:GH15 family glucan-1,4-alpha-glucosidase